MAFSVTEPDLKLNFVNPFEVSIVFIQLYELGNEFNTM